MRPIELSRVACFVFVVSSVLVAQAGTDGLRAQPAAGTAFPAAGREWPCPMVSYGQPAATSADPWSSYTSAITSQFSYKCYDNYFDVPNTVTFRFWGLSLHYSSGSGWTACDPSNLVFEVNFYGPGYTPGALICGPYEATPTWTVVDNVLGFDVYQFDAPWFDMPCSPGSGWISIQSLQNDADCAFLWFNSLSGDSNALQDQGGNLQPLYQNLAFCIGGYILWAGACCLDATGECQEYIDAGTCFALGGRWGEMMLCAELDPPCGLGPGACCYDNGLCTPVTRDLCGTLVGDANCDGVINFDDINPFVEVLSTGESGRPGCPVGNCDTNTNGVVDFDDIDPFIAILSGAQPAPLGHYLGEDTTCDHCACLIDCPPGATSENEPCGERLNDGCYYVSPHLFGTLHCGETICGTSYYYYFPYWVDPDWFIIAGLSGPCDLQISATAEFDLQLQLLTDTGPGDCATSTVASATAGPCAPATIDAPDQSAPTFYVCVIPQGPAAFGCTAGHPQYWVHLDCTPLPRGACYLGDTCRDGASQHACQSAGGVYQGDHTTCAAVNDDCNGDSSTR